MGTLIEYKIGLGIYGGSGSSDDDDSGAEDSRKDQYDSEMELKVR